MLNRKLAAPLLSLLLAFGAYGCEGEVNVDDGNEQGENGGGEGGVDVEGELGGEGEGEGE
ncbi:MAG TPA: hypothetical protein VM573_01920 [Actinomycetota bacterium]|jgi:hypothetical protein|nr:hypothetical protein [Actinomycetota bacterium]